MGIKANFGISIAAGARRAYDLKLISQAQFRSIQKQLSARQWRKVEPVEVPQEKPVLISKVINAMAGKGPTLQKANRLVMPIFIFRALMTLNQT